MLYDAIVVGSGPGGATPKAEHLSVGIAALGPRPGELQRTLKRVMQRYGVELDGARLHGHTLPLYTGKQLVGTRRVLLVGDAAALVDPLTGEGIRFAICSEHLAAEALLSGRPERYGGWVRRRIGGSHALGRRLVYGSAVPGSTAASGL